MTRPRIADLFCGAGGAAMGLHRAGFEVVGFDIKPQPRYPFEFYETDALEVDLSSFTAVWASPPCQFATMASRQWRAEGREYPNLIEPTRQLLQISGLPYVIENVPNTPLIDPVVLNGAFFGMKVRRTRWFECSFPMPHPLLLREEPSNFRMGRPVQEGGIITPVGHFSGVQYARDQMGIPWMTQAELAQAIPPAYSEYIGKQLIKYCGVRT